MRISGSDRFNLSIGSGCNEYKIKLYWNRCWSPRKEGVDWLEKGRPSKGPLSGFDWVKQLTSGHQMLQPGSCMMGLWQLTSLEPLGHAWGWICPLIELGEEMAPRGPENEKGWNEPRCPTGEFHSYVNVYVLLVFIIWEHLSPILKAFKCKQSYAYIQNREVIRNNAAWVWQKVKMCINLEVPQPMTLNSPPHHFGKKSCFSVCINIISG